MNWKTIFSLGIYDLIKMYIADRKASRLQNAELARRQKESDYYAEKRKKIMEMRAKAKAA